MNPLSDKERLYRLGTLHRKRLMQMYSDLLGENIEQRDYIDRLKAALEEIRDIANTSDGVEFYAMLADKALTYRKDTLG